MNNEEFTNPASIATTVTKVLAIGRFTELGKNNAERMKVFPFEAPATLSLFLDGKIEQMFAKHDLSGPIFILNVKTAEEAHNILETLPFGIKKMMEFDFIPMGPLSPLRLLINN